MQCDYRDNANGRTTAAGPIADAWSRDGLDVDFREVAPDTCRPLTDGQPYRAGTAARHAPTTVEAAPDEYVPPDPMLEIDRHTMALLGDLADHRREDESAVAAAAVAAFHAATFTNPEPQPPTAAPATDPTPSHPTGARFRASPQPRRPSPCASQ